MRTLHLSHPSIIDFSDPSIIGLAEFFFIVLTGSQRISFTELLTENLKTWSENFSINTAEIDPRIRKPVDPNIIVVGNISRPARMPNLVKIKPVNIDCINNVAAPVYM